MPSLAELIKQEQEAQKKAVKAKIQPEIISEKKIQKITKKTPKKEQEYKLTSDNLRTIFYMITGNSSRKRIEELKSELINILKNN